MNKLKTLVLVVLLFFFGLSTAYATPIGTLTVSASNVVDSTGTPLVNGTVYFAPVDGSGNPISYRIGGLGQAISRPVQAPVVNGAFSVTLPDTHLTAPANVCFSVTVVDPNSGENVLGGGYSCVQPSSVASWCTSTTCNFDTYVPNLAAVALVQTGPAGPQGIQGAQGIPGSGNAAQGAPGSVQIAEGNGSGNVGPSDSSTILDTLPVQEYVTTSRPPLQAFLAALHNARNQHVFIDIIGDSRAVVDNATDRRCNPGSQPSIAVASLDRWIEQWRMHLQEQYGNGGPGMVPLKFLEGTSGCGYVPNPDFFSTTAAPTSTTSAYGPYQVNGATIVDAFTEIYPVGTVITFKAYEPYDQPKAWCSAGPSYGSWAMAVDGASVGTACPTTGTVTPELFTGSLVTSQTHTMTVTCSENPCALYALGGLNGASGVVFDREGIASGSAETFGYAPSTQFAYSDLNPPAALTVIQHLTNEVAQDATTSQYLTSLTKIYNHQTARGSSVYFFIPGIDCPNATNCATEYSEILPYYNVMETYAKSVNASYSDMRDRWGQSFNPYYFGPDETHENTLANHDEDTMAEATTSDLQTLPSSLSSCSAGTNYRGSDYRGQPICQAQLPARSCPVQDFARSVTLTVAASPAALADFPLLLSFNGSAPNSLTLSDFVGHVQNGFDIIACENGLQLSHETTHYDGGSGSLEMYVKAQLSATASSVITLYYDNPSAVDTSRAADVWSNGYGSVYHFSSYGDPLADSSGLGNEMTAQGSGSHTNPTGKFGTYESLTSSSGLLAFLNVAGVIDETKTIPGLPRESEARTVEAWFQFPTAPTSGSMMFNYGFYSENSNFGAIYGSSTIAMQTGEAGESFPFTPDTNWHFLAQILPAGGNYSSVQSFLDGSMQTMTCVTGLGPCTNSMKTFPNYLAVNGLWQPNNSLANLTAENVDELRVSLVQRSVGWLTEEYNNMTNQASFFTLGTPASPAYAPYTGTCAPTTTLTVSGGKITGCS